MYNKFSKTRKKKPFDVAAGVCVPKSLNVSWKFERKEKRKH